MKKIMQYVLFFLGIANGASGSAASFVMARAGELWSQADILSLMHLNGRSPEAFGAEAVGAVTEADLLLMAGSVLASEVATHPENFPSDKFKEGTDLVTGGWAMAKGAPPLLGGCTIVDILLPNRLPEDAGFAFPRIAGITLNTNSKHGIITCFGHTAFTSIRDLFITYAAVYVDGDSKAVIDEARAKLIEQLGRYRLPATESLSRLDIPTTGNILEADPEGLMFMAKSWVMGCVKSMDYHIRKNEPTKVCGPFFIQEMIRAFELMGGDPAKVANATTHVASYAAMGASNALLGAIKDILNGANEKAFIRVEVDNAAPVGKAVPRFKAYVSNSTLLQWGPRWGDIIRLPSGMIAVEESSAETGAGGAAAAGAGGSAASVTASEESFEHVPSEALSSLGRAYAALSPSGATVGALRDPGLSGAGGKPLVGAGAAKPQDPAGTSGTDAASTGGATASVVGRSQVPSLEDVIKWLTTTGIWEMLKAKGYISAAPNPFPVFAPGDPIGDLKYKTFQQFVLDAHDPKKLLEDMTTAYALQRGPDLESDLRTAGAGR